MKKTSFLLLSLLLILTVNAQRPFSIAGFFEWKNQGREVYDFNIGWRFYKGDVNGAEKVAFNDSKWDVVSTPHSVELEPSEASGGRNYQGIAWYRKHFTVDKNLTGKKVYLHFEAVMGKCKVYLNGKLVKEHFGGYLPFNINLTDLGVKPGEKVLLAVMADNSDDKTYAPGKKQSQLDFAYHGGMYRDVWMVAISPVHITDANEAGKVAGGGVFIHTENISGKHADVFAQTEVVNESAKAVNLKLETTLCDEKGNPLKKLVSSIKLLPGQSQTVKQQYSVTNPKLWTPDSPYLYQVKSRVLNGSQPLDGVMTRIGIRSIEFRGKEGFFLNGKPYIQLLGTNRHQDFAYVGNAMPNNMHWRDVKKLRDAGCRIIRSAHYPQDPSFLDACDELGMFLTVATPGWQYWNKKDSIFELRVYDDVKNMIRRDRNHACVIAWESVLNETQYPLTFSKNVLKITHDEYPYKGCYVVGDIHSAGVAENYDLVYGWPKDTGTVKQCIFTREFGETVDDWYAHNNNNRAARSWGERPQIVQALRLAQTYDEMYTASKQFVGGAQWHAFDHQRGYHPDPYFGGMMDNFRQPKYAYYMFKSQQDADVKLPVAESGPMVYIAHEITPFSDPDVVVFTNCDEVRLIVYEKDTLVMKAPKVTPGMPHPPVIFRNVFDFMKMRILTYEQKKWQQVSFVAEGLIDGKVVATTKKMPSRRSTKLRLTLDNDGQSLVANGSDFAVVVAEVTDDEGNVRRLAKDQVYFTVEGEGEVIGDDHIGANPRMVEFGSAPVLIRSTLKPGKIRVNARVLFEGEHAPKAASIEFESVPASFKAVYEETPKTVSAKIKSFGKEHQSTRTDEERKRELLEVQDQQKDFGEKYNTKK